MFILTKILIFYHVSCGSHFLTNKYYKCLFFLLLFDGHYLNFLCFNAKLIIWITQIGKKSFVQYYQIFSTMMKWKCCLWKSHNTMLVNFISLIIQRCSIWHSNHTSHKKNYFYEFVANVLCDNIGILIFDLHGGW